MDLRYAAAFDASISSCAGCFTPIRAAAGVRPPTRVQASSATTIAPAPDSHERIRVAHGVTRRAGIIVKPSTVITRPFPDETIPPAPDPHVRIRDAAARGAR